MRKQLYDHTRDTHCIGYKISHVFYQDLYKIELKRSQFSFQYIPSECNPADIATNEISPDHLANFQPWWTGSKWIKDEESKWPQWEYNIHDECEGKGLTAEETEKYDLHYVDDFWQFVHRLQLPDKRKDYLGPITVKTKIRSKKRWIALFTCFTSRAVHLELVDDSTAEIFLIVLRRFVARRGYSELILSPTMPVNSSKDGRIRSPQREMPRGKSLNRLINMLYPLEVRQKDQSENPMNETMEHKEPTARRIRSSTKKSPIPNEESIIQQKKNTTSKSHSLPRECRENRN
ncbi:unnamed protein product [Onchocerca ochengi]|uniref:Calpain catalytic domain-containing protein n=1 Tax=Onchocerca ochengi TaxID=42157 RepID=A0A182EMU3_ONCOC|nr:unnamed protein product [Onchocerca ochengi]